MSHKWEKFHVIGKDNSEISPTHKSWVIVKDLRNSALSGGRYFIYFFIDEIFGLILCHLSQIMFVDTQDLITWLKT